MTAGFMRPPGREMFCPPCAHRSEEHTSELQSRLHLVCRLLLEKKKKLLLELAGRIGAAGVIRRLAWLSSADSSPRSWPHAERRALTADTTASFVNHEATATSV